MATIYEIRRDNLRRVVNANAATGVAKACGYASASYISQMAGRNPTRPITEDNARKFEKALGMEPGSLDIERAPYERIVGKAPTPGAEVQPIVMSTLDHTRFAEIITVLKRALAEKGADVSNEKFASLATVLYDDFSKTDEALHTLACRLVDLAT